MAFVDEIKLFMKAGRGGDGVVRWLHEKGKEFLGPSGGDGGRGGNIYAHVVRDLNILSSYKNTKEFKAENGASGMRNSRKGKDGEDLYIDFPLGAVITNHNTGEKISLDKEGENVFLLQGGRGGLGNEYFKASTNVRPQQSTKGKDGEEADFSIELELFADMGLVGLPNAGKSSLINELTNANSKVGAYAFTTLEPSLGALYGYVIADIPGLIEGASQGKGLGHKFLRHIKRTKVVLHCVSLENEDVVSVYETVRKELNDYSKDLASKSEIIILTKTDTVSKEVLDKKKKSLAKFSEHIVSVTVYDDEAIKELKDYLVKYMRSIGDK